MGWSVLGLEFSTARRKRVLLRLLNLKIILKFYLFLNIFAQNLATVNEKIGAEGLALPPIFSIQNKAELVDSKRSLLPATKSLEALSTKFKNGDILFIRSTSIQSKALEEVTGSQWTHVGILYRVKLLKSGGTVLLPSDSSVDSKGGQWMVFEAGPRVRFTPVERFVGAKAFAVHRLKMGVNETQARQLFNVGLSRLGKPYDIYFLLTHDGKTKDTPDYCSELVWYVYAKALNIQLGYQVQIASQKLEGPEAQKLIKQRLSKKDAPLTVEKWKENFVIPPEAQFLSPLLERVDN